MYYKNTSINENYIWCANSRFVLVCYSCWIHESIYSLALSAPVCISMVANFVFLINIVRLLLTKLHAAQTTSPPPRPAALSPPANTNNTNFRSNRFEHLDIQIYKFFLYLYHIFFLFHQIFLHSFILNKLLTLFLKLHFVNE